MNQDSSVLFVDAYDSFAGNIIALLRQELHVNITVIKIDTVLNDPVSFFQTFQAIVLRPGPGNPDNEILGSSILFGSMLLSAQFLS